MTFTTPVPMTHPCSHYRPFPFPLNPHAPQYDREQRERALALHIQQQLVNQPTSNALHAQEYDESPDQDRMMRDVLYRMPDDQGFDVQFPFDGDSAHKKAEIQRADRAIRNQAVCAAHLEEQRLLARRRRLDAENFFAGTINPRCFHGFNNSASCDLLQSKRRLMAEHRSEVTLSARLKSPLAAFQFPAELDFFPALGTADVFALIYTPANAPVRAQEHALSLLFADLDNIPSFGSDVVRNARRAVVTRVDEALKELDKGVKERKGHPVTMPIEQPANVTSADAALKSPL
ncbi:uncharacterized protein HD556DRAFT_1485632 [Suillus plorans]|uniref:BAG domain-containing protein n=1 Tax=Suillus plorans TaxID=116603 RepID=A0A9P7DBQ0_9AGAM|nr:uncharacterized protein HD556DRAFT_1507475 [Suillus plorans]XP_041158319.1 uncharacterized protein HD556DRAFT_1485632 [Suillus plorans]KAG1786341.1 hypothetical protein HD556DRAFT_1507475 [Suillus plorans]KAG1791513.1 hypothetical protein HD556DRAFT_1485632 [Suillus plorans]